MRFVAGRGAVTESHLEDVAGRGAVAEQMAGSAMAKRMAALWQRAIGKMLLARAPQWQRCWQAGALRQSCRQERRGRAAGRQPQEGITAQKKESDP